MDIEENKITSTSPATAIDVALELVAELTTQENAQWIRELMGFVTGTSRKYGDAFVERGAAAICRTDACDRSVAPP